MLELLLEISLLYRDSKINIYKSIGGVMPVEQTEIQVSGTVIAADTQEVAEAMAKFLAEDFGRQTPTEAEEQSEQQ